MSKQVARLRARKKLVASFHSNTGPRYFEFVCDGSEIPLLTVRGPLALRWLADVYHC